MKRMTILAALALAAAPAAAQPSPPRPGATLVSRSTQTTRTWQTAGSLVELVSFDRASRTVRIGLGATEQTLVMGEGTDAGFDALAAGAPVFLSWRFNRAAQPEAVVRVLTEDGTVSMVGWASGQAAPAAAARRVK